MANQFEKGRSFSPGDTVEAADLNNLVDHADALKGLILEATVDNTPVPNLDSVLYYSSAATDLRRCLISAIGAGTVTSVGLSVPTADFNLGGTNPIIAAGTFNVTWKSKAANLFLAGPVTGGTTTPTFRAIAPQDTSDFVTIPAHLIDCTLGNVFHKVLSGTGTEALKLDNGIAGQRITVFLQQGPAPSTTAVTWDTVDVGGIIRWPAGTDHTMTTGLNHVDIVNFLCTGSELYWGTFNKDFLP